jgi:hypothetical protein
LPAPRQNYPSAHFCGNVDIAPMLEYQGFDQTEAAMNEKKEGFLIKARISYLLVLSTEGRRH